MPDNSSKKLVQSDKGVHFFSKQAVPGPENSTSSTDPNLSLTNLARLTDQSSTRLIVQRKVLDLQRQHGNRFTRQFIQNRLQRLPVADPAVAEEKPAPTGEVTPPLNEGDKPNLVPVPNGEAEEVAFANQAEPATTPASNPPAPTPTSPAAATTNTTVSGPGLAPTLTNWKVRLSLVEARYQKYEGSEERISAEEKAALRKAVEAGEYKNSYKNVKAENGKSKSVKVSGWGKLADVVWKMRNLPSDANTPELETLYSRIQNSAISLTRLVLKIKHLSGKDDAFSDIKQGDDGTFTSSDKGRKYDPNLAGGRGLAMVALGMEKLGMKYVDWDDKAGIAEFPSGHDQAQAGEDENKKASLVCSHFVGQVFGQAGGSDIFGPVTSQYKRHIRYPQQWTIVKGPKCIPALDPTTNQPTYTTGKEHEPLIKEIENIAGGAGSIQAGDFGLRLKKGNKVAISSKHTLAGKFQHIVLFTGRTVNGKIEYIHAPDTGTGVQLSLAEPEKIDEFAVIMRPTQAAFDKAGLGEKKSFHKPKA